MKPRGPCPGVFRFTATAPASGIDDLVVSGVPVPTIAATHIGLCSKSEYEADIRAVFEEQ